MIASVGAAVGGHRDRCPRMTIAVRSCRRSKPHATGSPGAMPVQRRRSRPAGGCSWSSLTRDTDRGDPFPAASIRRRSGTGTPSVSRPLRKDVSVDARARSRTARKRADLSGARRCLRMRSTGVGTTSTTPVTHRHCRAAPVIAGHSWLLGEEMPALAGNLGSEPAAPVEPAPARHAGIKRGRADALRTA